MPISSMYGIFTYIYHTYQPNVGKYTIHGWYGMINYQPQVGEFTGFSEPSTVACPIWGLEHHMEDTVTGQTVKKRLAILRGSCCNVSWEMPSDVLGCLAIPLRKQRVDFLYLFRNCLSLDFIDFIWWNLTYINNLPEHMVYIYMTGV